MLIEAGEGLVYVLWAAFAVCAVLSIVLFTGRGTRLIAGYNTASEQEKNRYDKKKLSIVMGSGMALISVFLLVMAICVALLPFWIIYVLQGVVAADCITTVVLVNTVCKKKKTPPS